MNDVIASIEEALNVQESRQHDVHGLSTASLTHSQWVSDYIKWSALI